MADPNLLVIPNPVVAEMAPYTGAPPDPLIELKLDSNESAAPLPPLDRHPLADDGWQANRYMRTSELELRIADRLGLDPSRVLVTAGADDGLERALRAVCKPGRNGILTLPTFEVLERYVRLSGAEPRHVPWWRNDFPVNEVLCVADGETAAVAVVTPNNPTGAVASRQAVVELADRLQHSLILLDHAYVEYADPEHDLSRCAVDLPNVLAFRTFSKAWSAAGLRVGYAIGDPRVLRWLRTLGQPYPVSAPSVAFVLRLIDRHPELPTDRLSRVHDERDHLQGIFRDLGIESLPSHANFVLARCGEAQTIRRALTSLGVGVRAFPGRPGLDDWLRITVPEDDKASSRLERALRTVLTPEAVLFDLDGVLADVGGSYREAMRRTAADFDVTIDHDDIVRAKTEGHANNDWELTHRLLAAHGVEVGLDEVGRCFESWYQGTKDRPGLWTTERPLLDLDRLDRLARRYPLAIVTGRPLDDARRFLERHDMTDFFTALVTMEDGPLKPDPAPVRIALERLGVGHAWMLGDTPDDIHAARGAGVLPIGCLAPGAAAVPEQALLDAGAAHVLASASELEEVLP